MKIPLEIVNKIIMLNRSEYKYIRELQCFNRIHKNDFLTKTFNYFFMLKMLHNDYTIDFDMVLDELKETCLKQQ